jgi:hypothetical protein
MMTAKRRCSLMRACNDMPADEVPESHDLV